MTLRAETGVMQFKDDWPGVFIRGDNALYFAAILDELLKKLPPSDYFGLITKAVLDGLVSDLRSCHTDFVKPEDIQHAILKESAMLQDAAINIKEAEFVEIKVSRDGKTVWVNTETGCLLRVNDIQNGVKVEDERMT